MVGREGLPGGVVPTTSFCHPAPCGRDPGITSVQKQAYLLSGPAKADSSGARERGLNPKNQTGEGRRRRRVEGGAARTRFSHWREESAPRSQPSIKGNKGGRSPGRDQESLLKVLERKNWGENTV